MIDLGFWQIRWYGVLVAVGVTAGVLVMEWIRKRWYPKLSSAWDALPWMVVPGVVGARLYHVIDLWGYYRENWVLIPQVWTGGLGIFGAIGGAVVGLWFFARKQKQSFLSWLDIVAIGAPLTQAIGRWGNYFNEELYGLPFDSFGFTQDKFAQDKPPFFAIYVSPENRLSGYEQYTHFHPLFLYESAWNMVLFLVLLRISIRQKKQLKPGTLFTLYILFYSLGRFFLERLRIDPWVASGVPVAQIVGGGLIMVSILVLWRRGWEK